MHIYAYIYIYIYIHTDTHIYIYIYIYISVGVQKLLYDTINKCRSNFENIAFPGNLNIEPTNPIMTTFVADNNLLK